MTAVVLLAVLALLAGCSHAAKRPRPTADPNLPTASRGSATADVRPCKDDSFVTEPGGPVPATVRLPSPLTLPRQASVAGLPLGRGDAVHYVLGPEAGTCTYSVGADGSARIDLEARDGRSGVREYAPGGVLLVAKYGCEYIPDIALLVPGEDCTRPPGVEVAPVTTGVRDLYASLVWSPHDDLLWGGTPEYGTVSLFVSSMSTYSGQRYAAAAWSSSCSLPDTDDDICTASLSYLLAQMGDAVAITTPDRRRLTGIISTFVRGHHA